MMENRDEHGSSAYDQEQQLELFSVVEVEFDEDFLDPNILVLQVNNTRRLERLVHALRVCLAYHDSCVSEESTTIIRFIAGGN